MTIAAYGYGESGTMSTYGYGDYGTGGPPPPPAPAIAPARTQVMGGGHVPFPAYPDWYLEVAPEGIKAGMPWFTVEGKPSIFAKMQDEVDLIPLPSDERNDLLDMIREELNEERSEIARQGMELARQRADMSKWFDLKTGELNDLLKRIEKEKAALREPIGYSPVRLESLGDGGLDWDNLAGKCQIVPAEPEFRPPSLWEVGKFVIVCASIVIGAILIYKYVLSTEESNIVPF